MFRRWLFAPILTLLENITMKQSELAAELLAARDQVEKFRLEIIAHVTNLEAAIVAAGNTAPEVDAALVTLKTSLQTVDDIHPDQAPVPTAA